MNGETTPRIRMLDFFKNSERPGIMVSPVVDELFVSGVVGKDWLHEVSWADQVSVAQTCGYSPFFLIHGVLDYSEEDSRLKWTEEIVDRTADSITRRLSLQTPRGVLTQVVTQQKKTAASLRKSAIQSTEDYGAAMWYLEKIAQCRSTIENRVQEAKAAVGDAGLVQIFAFQPFESYALLDYDEMILHQIDFPDLHADFKKLVFDCSLHIIETALNAGCDSIYFGSPGTETLSPAMWAEEFLDSSVAYEELIRRLGGISYFHLCGKIQRLLDLGILQVICPDILESFSPQPEGDVNSLSAARQAFPAEVCTKGNLSLDLLLRGTPQDVYQAARDAVRGVEGYRHVLSSTCSLLRDTPVEKVRMLSEAAGALTDSNSSYPKNG